MIEGASRLYTWKPPYSDYEIQVLIIKGIGDIFVTIAVVDLIAFVVLTWYKNYYKDKHIQDIHTDHSGAEITYCPNCGLQITSSIEKCPRCGKEITK